MYKVISDENRSLDNCVAKLCHDEFTNLGEKNISQGIMVYSKIEGTYRQTSEGEKYRNKVR